MTANGEPRSTPASRRAEAERKTKDENERGRAKDQAKANQDVPRGFRGPTDDYDNPQERRRDNPEQSRAEKRAHRHEVQADAARPGENDLKDNKIDREGPVCEVIDASGSCQTQQDEEHDGLCAYHRRLVADRILEDPRAKSKR